MSKPNKNLSKSPSDIKKYLEWLGSFSFVEQVRVYGSRCPLNPRQPREDSDWDLIAICNARTIFPDPKKQFKLHVDVVGTTKEGLEVWPKSVEVWPKDEYDLLK